jgi:hypothetical protein
MNPTGITNQRSQFLKKKEKKNKGSLHFAKGGTSE